MEKYKEHKEKEENTFSSFFRIYAFGIADNSVWIYYFRDSAKKFAAPSVTVLRTSVLSL